MSLKLAGPILLTLAFLTCAVGASAEVTLTFGGDLNLNSSREEPSASGALKNGRLYPFAPLFSGIQSELDGQLNFANLETVISDRTDLPQTGGEFVFVTHPNGLHAAASAGLNFFNLANNHIGDHALMGIEETLRHLTDLERQAPISFSGLASDRETALRPTVVEIKRPEGTFRIAILSFTGLSNAFSQAGPGRAGTLYLHDPRDLHEGLAQLAATPADYKIISIHGGKENVAAIDPDEPELYRRILAEGDADLILGHHPHRARAVEKVGKKLIFYSLGNFLMLGAADLTELDTANNYGLFGKLHLSWDPGARRLVAQAVEAIPLTEMQLNPRPLPTADSARHITVLNTLGKGELGDSALIFKIDERGRGVSCLSDRPGPRAGAVCASAR